MNARHRRLAVAIGLAAAVLSLGASAQVANPDNDSATFFKYTPAAAAPAARSAAPAVGAISTDGLYVYSGGERGWVNRQHSFELAGGVLAHTSDCLAYDAPQPAKGGMVAVERGPFAEHGA
jgi:hypothetical protein